MKPPINEPKTRLGLTLGLANSAALIAMLVMVAAGQIRSWGDFLHGLAYALIFANLTSLIGSLLIGVVLKKRGHRRIIPPLVVLGFIFAILVGCLTAPLLLFALRFTSEVNFWSDYWGALKVVMPLALVFGLGAIVYSSLDMRLQNAERQLREKELAEERTQKLAAETRLRSLESWIHPHYLFNTLNSISALIPVDAAQAERMVGRFAHLLRTSLDARNESLIPLEQELAFVESYVDIERIRFGHRLRGEIKVEEHYFGALVPPMSIQTLVENAIKHGVDPHPLGGEIRVTARSADHALIISVRDSGPGFELASIPPEHGLDKLVQRLEVLYNGRAAIQVSRDDGSCLVEMILPLV